jgi:large subunit ribosomal protein L17
LLHTATTDLLRYEAIRTTEAKAKEIRRMAEKVITRGKKNTLHSRRLAARVLTDDRVLRKLFDELGPRYEDRPGGYTRIMKLGTRKGDAAEMAIIELMP